MDWGLLWKAVLIVIGGTLLLRVAGRKSISQMTLAQVVIMIGLGSLLVQPIVGRNVWATLVVGLSLVMTLVVIEFLQVKFNFVEKFITGQSKILIENGTINSKSMSKLRMTVDQLEMQLRQRNVTSISDVQSATLEPSGQLGFVLKPAKQNATKEDLDQIKSEIQQLRQFIHTMLPQTKVVYKSSNQVPVTPFIPPIQAKEKQNDQFDLFDEVRDKGHKQEPPEHLQ